MRYGQVCKLKKNETLKKKYIELHKNPWPEIGEIMRTCNMKNFTIFNIDDFLFAYFDYKGKNYQEDMKTFTSHPIVKKWKSLCDPCMESYINDGDLWTDMNLIAQRD